MGAVKVVLGSSVKLKQDGRLGKVISLTPQKTGTRGRPKTYAAIVLEDGNEISLGVRELDLA